MDSLGIVAQSRLVAEFARERIFGKEITQDETLLKLRALVRYAYENTQFYRHKFSTAGLHPQDVRTWQDVEQIPLTTKEELVAAGAAAHVRERIPSAFLSRTSGSSGVFLDLYAGSDFWIKDGIIGVNAYNRHIGLRASDRLLYANTSRYPFKSVGGLFYRVAYFNNLRPVQELAEALLRSRPHVLMVYPSIAADLMDVYSASHFPALKAVITHSEQSSQEFRDEIGKYFSCPVYDEYATEELGRVALQCRLGTYHLLERQSHCEIIDPESGRPVEGSTPGEIVGTCLINTTMPIIRYRQGDLASVGSADCPCGAGRRRFHSLLGRRNASFRLADGKEISSGRLLDWTYHLILTGRIDIRQFELVQTRHDHVRFFVVPGPSYDTAVDAASIVRSFHELLTPGVHVQVVEVPSIARAATGKRILIRSELQHPNERRPA